MTKETEEKLFREVLEAEGIKTEISHLEYIARLIKNFPHWWKITKERLKLSDICFLIKGRL